MSEPGDRPTPRYRRLPVMLGRKRMNPGERKVWTPRSAAARWHEWATLAGLALAAGGAFLGLQPAPVPVGLDASGYRIGDSLMTPAGPGLYAGGGAVAISHSGGKLHAAGSTTTNGVKTIGICTMDDLGLTESCTFTAGGTSFSATDRKAEQSWIRRYSDGKGATIQLVSGASVPVPFAVGR
ncbi:MAG: hypothetical protein ACYDGR_11270 [Candidatus Dormibacteria bacterium]